MTNNQRSSAIIDGLLRFVAVGGLLTFSVMAPNAVQTLDKPLQAYFNRLDKRAREREYIRYLQYMKRRGLVKIRTEDYEHGIKLTGKGKSRAEKSNFKILSITPPLKWDNKWRLVLFDIPEDKKLARDSFSRKLNRVGLRQLQRSVWVHPFPCRNEVGVIAKAYGIEKYATYIETNHIDASKKLKERFMFKF